MVNLTTAAIPDSAGAQAILDGIRERLPWVDVRYRSAGRLIGLHGAWTPELARQEAKTQLGRVAKGGNPARNAKLITRQSRSRNRAAFTLAT